MFIMLDFSSSDNPCAIVFAIPFLSHKTRIYPPSSVTTNPAGRKKAHKLKIYAVGKEVEINIENFFIK